MFGKKTVEALLPRTVIKTGDTLVDVGPELTKLALEGWKLKKEIDALGERLKAVNEQILDAVEPGSTVLVDDVVQIPVSERETIGVADAQGLRDLLGPRFDDLINETVSYSLSPKAKEMAADGDDATGLAMRPLLKVSSSKSVSYRGGKPLPKAA